MNTNFLTFFSPPIFEDEEKTRKARLLTITVGIILSVAFLRTAYAFFTADTYQAYVLIVNLVLILLFGSAYILGRMGYIYFASIILTGTQWLTTALIVYAFGGVSISSYGIFVFVIFVSGLLLNGRWAVGYAVASFLFGLYMLYLENQGVITPPLESGSSAFNTITPSFITTSVLVFLYSRDITNALSLAQRNEQKMTQHAKKLEQVNTQLKKEIAERERLEAQLLQSQKLEAIGKLSGGIAHDLNNLLVPIMGYVDLSLTRATNDQKLHRYLWQVKEGAEKASNLTKQILAFSRKQALEITPFNPNDVLQSFETMLKRLIGENIDMHTSLNEAHSFILGDKSQFEQVLMNLVINARDAMINHGRLTLSLEDVFVDSTFPEVVQGEIEIGHYVLLAVSDTGHGMDKETLKQIFDPFFTTKNELNGTGLGLSTVFGIVKQHKGHIWVYSELGKGTTFKIYWPKADQIAAAISHQDIEQQSFIGTETILLAEDNIMVRNFIYEALSEYGYQIIAPGTIQQAIDIATDPTQTIDLLLTDVIMPTLNGRQLHQRIITDIPDVKVLYMSGYTDDIIAHHMLLEQGLKFLSKPFSINQLTQKIRQVLDEGKS